MPPLVLIFLVLGTIFLGIATPTEGGAMGAVGALVLAVAKRRLNLRPDPSRRSNPRPSSRPSCVFILIGARVFSLTFYGVDGHKWVEHLLIDLPGGEVGFLIVVNVLVFVLAFFLDFFELAFIIVPLLGPVGGKARHRPDLVRRAARHQHADDLHASAVRLRAVLPALGGAARRPTRTRSPAQSMEPVTTGQIYWGAVPFVVIQVIMVGLAIAFPEMVMHYKGASTVDPATIEINIPPQMADMQRSSAERPTSARRPSWRSRPISSAPPAAVLRLHLRRRKRKSPALMLRALAFDPTVEALYSAFLRCWRHHEGVEGVFGDLPPEILLGAERPSWCRAPS